MGFFDKLFGKKTQERDEVRMEREARVGVSLGPEADRLVSELIDIGRGEQFLGKGTRYDDRMNHVRAREIGEALNAIGGKELMVEAYHRVKAANPYYAADRELEAAWNRVGDWLG